jgi:hypothetical protein
MYQQTELEPTLNQAISSLIQEKGYPFTAGVLEGILSSLLNSSSVTTEARAEVVSRIAHYAQT